MRKKLLAAMTAGMMMAGLFGGAALAGHGGAHEPQDKGLCTAYFNGQKKGHGKNGREQPPPFADLTSRAEEFAPENNDNDPNNDVTGFEAVGSFCGSLIGGNPEHGRHPECFENGAWNPDCDT